jgi:hypothetical protein
MKKKRPLTDERVVFTKAPSRARTSELGDEALRSLPQAKPAEIEPKPTEGEPEQKSLLQRATQAEPLEDREGLERAYQQGDFYHRGNTGYIAGSHYAVDWVDDLTKVPFWGDLRNSYRYKQVDKVLKENPQIHNLVGHSLGGSVAHELQRNHPGLRTVTYGSPAVSWRAGGERYRNGWDPVSMFDRGAVQQTHPNPLSHGGLTHDYHNFTNVSSRRRLRRRISN